MKHHCGESERLSMTNVVKRFSESWRKSHQALTTRCRCYHYQGAWRQPTSDVVNSFEAMLDSQMSERKRRIVTIRIQLKTVHFHFFVSIF